MYTAIKRFNAVATFALSAAMALVVAVAITSHLLLDMSANVTAISARHGAVRVIVDPYTRGRHQQALELSIDLTAGWWPPRRASATARPFVLTMWQPAPPPFPLRCRSDQHVPLEHGVCLRSRRRTPRVYQGAHAGPRSAFPGQGRRALRVGWAASKAAFTNAWPHTPRRLCAAGEVCRASPTLSCTTACWAATHRGACAFRTSVKNTS